MMRYLLIAGTFFVSVLAAALFDKDVKFKDYDTTMKRTYPTHKEFLLSYNNVLEDVRTSVVNISTEKSIKVGGGYANPFLGDPFFREFFRGFGDPGLNIPQERIQRSLGSGVIVSEDGYIITNNHVVAGADTIKVTVLDKSGEYDAKLVGTDAKSDLAVIKIELKGLNSVTFYDSDKVKVGDIVFALGNPFGVGETITQGIVSATGRSSVGIVEYEDFIQTDASINPGNSGGALVNSAGYLIGINSAIISRSGGNAGVGFAIPSNMVKTIGKTLIEEGKFTRAYLGVSISDVSDELSSFYGKKSGALVTSVEKNTPAEKISLKRGDLIVSVNGKAIDSANMLRNVIGAIAPGTRVKITFLRNKVLHEKSVTLQSLPNDSEIAGGYEYKGMALKPMTREMKRAMGASDDFKGLYVAQVKSRSVAQRAGILEQDIVIQVEEKEIGSIEGFKEAIKGQEKIRLYLYRRGIIFAVAF
ncbi:MAG: Do family serine endopeptidase [Campylobacterales bacterium]|nr:Do family serine endopeptidase [Campylobacterales bacterium]